ncbi:MAG: FkbM family methyltransferase [Bacteroidales bacterium]|nr:FkbM family methyltransferase [Bacteroidales bacterium]
MPFDKNEKDFLKFIELIDDGDHVLDIGANIGVMSYYFSTRLPNSAIHSFEPVPENMKVLLRVKRKLGLLNVKTYPFAVGNNSGKIKMIMPESNKAYLHGLSHVSEENSQDRGKKYEVEIKRLDDQEEFKGRKVSAIKIDVEEYEYNVLKGAEILIEKNRPVIYCELWEGENREKSFELISKLNYKVFINQGKDLIEFKNQKGYQNFFFIPTECCDN